VTNVHEQKGDLIQQFVLEKDKLMANVVKDKGLKHVQKVKASLVLKKDKISIAKIQCYGKKIISPER